MLLIGAFDHGVEQVADDGVAVGDDPDLAPSSHQFGDHAGSGIGLSRTGRALDWEDAGLDDARDPKGGAECVLAIVPNCALVPDAMLQARLIA